MGAHPSSCRIRTSLGWFGLVLALVALHSIWSLSLPLMASPDEPSHVVHAAAVARGQWSGVLGPAPTVATGNGATTTVELPSDYLSATSLPNCFAFHPTQPASCQKPIPAPDEARVAVDTLAGQYPPLYYLLVGWPSRFLSAGASIYAMRMVSGALASALVVWGLYRLRSATLPALWAWAAVTAITPMTLFIGAMVNPQALEIPAAFAFWAACLVLARSPDAPSRGAVVQAAVTGALLLNSRTSGPVWALTIVVVALVFTPRGRLQVLWSFRSLRWALAVAVVAGLTAAAWVATHGAVVGGAQLYPQFASPVRVAWLELAQSPTHYLQMIGNFGWLDTPSPWVTILVWSGLLGTLFLVTVTAVPSRRVRIALLLSVAAVLLVPVALQVPTAANTGIIWQGRYTLPAAVGVPMVAAVGLMSAATGRDEVVRRLVRWAALPSVAIAHVAAFLWAMRRYSVGSEGPLLTRSPDWSSPLGYLSAVALYAVPITVLACAAWYALRPASTTTTPDENTSESLVERVASPVERVAEPAVSAFDEAPAREDLLAQPSGDGRLDEPTGPTHGEAAIGG